MLLSVALGQAGLSANAGGLSLSMGQSKSGSGSAVLGGGSSSVSTDRTLAASGSLTVNLDQYANSDDQWQNGDLNGNNSAYGEGMVVPFRLAIEGLGAGQHTIHLNHDFLTGGSEAYDFLATWNVSENPNKCADPNSGGASSHCPNDLGSADTHAFPADGFSPAVSPGLTVNGAIAFAGVSRNLTMYGGTIDSIGAPTHASGKTDMAVTFTSTSDWAFFLWGAHIAQSAYWNESNGGSANGAATISGAPWHMRTQQLDGSANKNQDRSIQPSAIVTEIPGISVVKEADASTIDAGDQAGFTITVTNDGPGDADDVTLTDTLPSGIAWDFNQVTGGWTCGIAAGVLTCGGSGFTLADGASASVHVFGTTDAQDCGVLTNTATASASNADAPDSDTAEITVNCPDISITKTADQGTVSAGDTIGFTIEATNTGDGTAHGVTVTDTLPSDAGLSWTIDAATSDAGCSIAAGVLTCDWGDLASGASKSVHITSPTTAATCGTVDNTASVTTSNDGSDSDDASVTVECPDVTVTKTADADPVENGDAIGFTITVGNDGPGTATGVTLSDTLPTNGGLDWAVDLVDGQAPAGQCAIAGGDLTCDFGDMVEGSSHTVHLTSPTDGTTCGAVDNTAVVAALNEPESATGNNEASASLLVICPAIQITKTVDPKSGTPGDTVTYTYVVKNVGDTTLYDISVDDDVIGHIGDIAQLDPGDSVTLTKDFVLPAGNPVVTNVGTATGTDVLGTQVSDDDDAFVTIVEAENPPPTPPTAFTGSDAARLGLIGGLMLAIGIAALVLGRRRRSA